MKAKALVGPIIIAWSTATVPPLHAQDEPSAQDEPLDALVNNPQTWEMTAAQFAEEFAQHGFRWNSDAKRIARSASPSLSLWGEPVGETLVDFNQKGTVARIAISIYNRGDDPDIKDRIKFESLVADWRDRITQKTGLEPIDRGRSKTSAVRAEGWLFKDGTTTRLLEFSAQRGSDFLGEFVKFRLAPTPKDDFLRRHMDGGLAPQVSKDHLPSNVAKLDNGDVVIQGIPMVDQGAKGYCVVATTERVMRYYGLQVDQHEMAQVAGADAARGTNTSAMITSLKRLTGRLRLRVRTHEEGDWNDFKDMAHRYSRYARRHKKREVDPERYMAYVYELFDPEILKESKLDSPASYTRWQSDIIEHIDEGIPVLWTLYMGYFPEEGIPQPPNSGHMRLIIGYNEETEEIIYSDSWGQGHEIKRQPMENAFTSTTGLYTIEPTR